MNETFERRKPTHTFTFMSQDGKRKGQIGVGWMNTDGRISIRLNPLVTIDEREGYWFSLFPAEYKSSKKTSYDSRKKAQSSDPLNKPTIDPDDVPF